LEEKSLRAFQTRASYASARVTRISRPVRIPATVDKNQLRNRLAGMGWQLKSAVAYNAVSNGGALDRA